MQLTSPVIGMKGVPPVAFTPGRMSSDAAVGEQGRRRDISVANASVTIRTTAVGPTTRTKVILPRRLQGLINLTLEMRTAEEKPAALSDIKFEVSEGENGELTLVSERQQTPWRFRVTADANRKQMTLSFTLNYSGLSVAEAVKGVRFCEALARGGEFHVYGHHPITGADLPIMRGSLPEGSFEGPDARFVRIVSELALIQEKTGVSFTIPARNITFQEASTIAATAQVVKTGHAQYKAEPWISVSTLERATLAYESLAREESIPMALHFDGQMVDIFDTQVALGPVTFFCDRMHITAEDLEALRKEIEAGTPESSVNIRFTPFADSVVEGRYLNWLPEDEAAAIRQLPMYRESEQTPGEDEWILPPMDVNKAVALLESWYDEDTEEQKKTWEVLKDALDRDRLSDRKLFS